MLTTPETVIERYARIRPRTDALIPESQLAELSSWLEHDVCPLADELCRRHDFRVVVTQAIKQLLPGSNSATRAAIEEVDATLLAWAKALLHFASQPANRVELSRVSVFNAYHEPAKSINDQRLKQPPTRADDRQTPLGLETVATIAARPWRDLVSAYDFFRPHAELNLIDRDAFWGPGAGTLLSFTLFGNPQLIIPGNHIVRALFLRLEFWQEQLQRFFIRCHTAHDHGKCTDEAAWEGVKHAAQQHEQSAGRLRGPLIGTKDASETASAMALVQLYADYRDDPDLDWLPAPKQGRTRRELDYFVRRRAYTTIPAAICSALCSLASFIDRETTWDDIEARVIDAYPLVVVDLVGRREVYWRGEQVKCNWYKGAALWALLVTLVESGKAGRGLDLFDHDRTERDTKSSLKSTRSRLGALLPESLDQNIEPAGTGSYRLSIPSSDVALVRREVFERLFIY